VHSVSLLLKDAIPIKICYHIVL